MSVRYVSLALNKEPALIREELWSKWGLFIDWSSVIIASLDGKESYANRIYRPRDPKKSLPSLRSDWDNLSSKTNTWFCSTVIGRLLGCVCVPCQKPQPRLLSSCFMSHLECQPLHCQNHDKRREDREHGGCRREWRFRSHRWLSSDTIEFKIHLS